ncbi:hypothetical protein FSARC_597 [Fusarium sarcochroum]|uniref:C3H1-type domain-containing protein n=1 Tax=Fusarium sarcochroum TaxID=1208366 RepID=A0A8H4UAV1_9HYPO|nr:hypothetical protein FSARC_597 [Fusarium sarcochroum]
MFTDAMLNEAASKLAKYRKNNNLEEILGKYNDLIEDYKRLKSDYEEECEGTERYKQLARGQERNPFALVVVDGDGYIFDEGFLKDGEQGGSKAAKQLNDRIQNSLHRKGLQSCEVMVRVYANLVGLSKALCKNGLSGAEKRSLSSFAADLSRSYGLTDFIDAGELKESADSKLKAILRFYANNAQCKHIYFAACHDVGYVSDLTPFRGHSDRFTLVKTPSVLFHREFERFEMNIEELPGVFRQVPLQYGYNSAQTRTSLGPSTIAGNSSQVYFSPTPFNRNANDGNTICRFHANGFCKYGHSCTFIHENDGTFSPSTTPSPSISGGGPKPHRNYSAIWRRGSSGSNAISNINTLPKRELIPDGYVAINGAGIRLDPYLPSFDAETVKRLKDLSSHKKLCNNAQLYNSCEKETCEYDHTTISAELKLALEDLSRSVPCTYQGRCRNAKCVYGHVCQKMDCRHRPGGKAPCRFYSKVHTTDYAAYNIVSGNDPTLMPVSLVFPPPSLEPDAAGAKAEDVRLRHFQIS